MLTALGGLVQQRDYDSSIIRYTLRKLRQDKKLSQDEVAKEVGVYKSVLSRLESGELEDPKFGLVAKLAYLYNIPLSDLASAAGLRVRDKVTPVDKIEDPRLRLAVENILATEDEDWKQQMITTIYMLAMTKPPKEGE